PLWANCSAAVGLCELRNRPIFGAPSRNCFLNSAPVSAVLMPSELLRGIELCGTHVNIANRRAGAWPERTLCTRQRHSTDDHGMPRRERTLGRTPLTSKTTGLPHGRCREAQCADHRTPRISPCIQPVSVGGPDAGCNFQWGGSGLWCREK